MVSHLSRTAARKTSVGTPVSHLRLRPTRNQSLQNRSAALETRTLVIGCSRRCSPQRLKIVNKTTKRRQHHELISIALRRFDHRRPVRTRSDRLSRVAPRPGLQRWRGTLRQPHRYAAQGLRRLRSTVDLGDERCLAGKMPRAWPAVPLPNLEP